jgi:hypothetical protein
MARRWPNLHKLAVTYLEAQTGKRIVTRIPATLPTETFYRVTRGPGTDDGVTDQPLLDVETFAANESAAWAAAEDAREAIHDLAGRAVNGALVDSVTTSVAPNAVDYGNPAIFRVVSSYRLHLRKS